MRFRRLTLAMNEVLERLVFLVMLNTGREKYRHHDNAELSDHSFS